MVVIVDDYDPTRWEIENGLYKTIEKLRAEVGNAEKVGMEKVLSEPEKWFEIDVDGWDRVSGEWWRGEWPAMKILDWVNKPENLKRILRRKP